MSEKLNLLIKVFSETLKCEVNLNTNKAEIMQWDSLKNLELILTLQDVFDYKFSTQQLAEAHSVREFGKILGIV